MQLNQKSTDPDLSQKKCQRETAGRNKQVSTYRAFFFAGELANANSQMERVAIKYELDRMIVSEDMFHYYHAFPIAEGANEGCNDGTADEGGNTECSLMKWET